MVGVAITRDKGGVCEIDSLLLSCRVIGRQVEHALLGYLVETARARNKLVLEGWFLPTKKNTPARDFYPRHGFRLEKQDGNATLWTLDLSEATVTCPEWIKLSVLAEDKN